MPRSARDLSPTSAASLPLDAGLHPVEKRSAPQPLIDGTTSDFAVITGSTAGHLQATALNACTGMDPRKPGSTPKYGHPAHPVPSIPGFNHQDYTPLSGGMPSFNPTASTSPAGDANLSVHEGGASSRGIATGGTHPGFTPDGVAQVASPLTIDDASRPASSAVQTSDSSSTIGENAMGKAGANQVNRSLLQQLLSGERMLVVRLTPPELGTVRIEVIELQCVLTAHLHAEDEGIRLALEHALPSMRDELRAHDAPIRDISLSDQASGRSLTEGQQQPQDRSDSGSTREPASGEAFSISTAFTVDSGGGGNSVALGGYVDGRGVDMRA